MQRPPRKTGESREGMGCSDARGDQERGEREKRLQSDGRLLPKAKSAVPAASQFTPV